MYIYLTRYEFHSEPDLLDYWRPPGGNHLGSISRKASDGTIGGVVAYANPNPQADILLGQNASDIVPLAATAKIENYLGLNSGLLTGKTVKQLVIAFLIKHHSALDNPIIPDRNGNIVIYFMGKEFYW